MTLLSQTRWSDSVAERALLSHVYAAMECATLVASKRDPQAQIPFNGSRPGP